jgi:alkanesulfonate monooxygenase SsuD/methylene tetrahydromethanopterin reductase-like flavin-dependent oxidoreductase (luciferase family)
MVDFGLALPAGPPKGEISRFTEDLNAYLPQLQGHFKSLWMTDHFFWDDEPTHEAWTVIAYLAALWPQFDVGPIVLGQSYRNPALLAKMGATLQALSGGRFIMAVGAGWKEDEYRAYGYPYPSPGVRVGQLKDTLEVIRRMWTEPGPATYRGKHYHIEVAYCEPKPDPIPPIMVGGGGYTTTRLAAQYADWWNMHDVNWPRYNDYLSRLRAGCEAVGRDYSTIRLTWFGRLVVGRTEVQAKALAGRWTTENAFVGTPQQVVEQMSPFVEAGVDYFMATVLGLPDPDVMGMLLEDVLPKVKGQG